MKLNVKKVRMEMDRQGLTYESIGKTLHITRQAVGYYLYCPSTLSLTTINKLAKVLNCDPKDLLI